MKQPTAQAQAYADKLKAQLQKKKAKKTPDTYTVDTKYTHAYKVPNPMEGGKGGIVAGSKEVIDSRENGGSGQLYLYGDESYFGGLSSGSSSQVSRTAQPATAPATYNYQPKPTGFNTMQDMFGNPSRKQKQSSYLTGDKTAKGYVVDADPAFTNRKNDVAVQSGYSNYDDYFKNTNTDLGTFKDTYKNYTADPKLNQILVENIKKTDQTNKVYGEKQNFAMADLNTAKSQFANGEQVYNQYQKIQDAIRGGNRDAKTIALATGMNEGLVNDYMQGRFTDGVLAKKTIEDSDTLQNYERQQKELDLQKQRGDEDGQLTLQRYEEDEARDIQRAEEADKINQHNMSVMAGITGVGQTSGGLMGIAEVRKQGLRVMQDIRQNYGRTTDDVKKNIARATENYITNTKNIAQVKENAIRDTKAFFMGQMTKAINTSALTEQQRLDKLQEVRSSFFSEVGKYQDEAYNAQKEQYELLKQEADLQKTLTQEKQINIANTMKNYEGVSMTSSWNQIDQMAQNGEIDVQSARILKANTITSVVETLNQATNGLFGSQNMNKIQEMLIQGKTPQEVVGELANTVEFGQAKQQSGYDKLNPIDQLDYTNKALAFTGASGDLRHLAPQFPGQARAKNNNPAGITWNANFDKGTGTAGLFKQAGIAYSKGTARPSNEGGNYVTFNTIEDGLKAQRILMTQTYGNNTVQQMLGKWVGTGEALNYAKQVAGMAGVDLNATVNKLSDEQIAQLQMAKIKKESPGLAKLLGQPTAQGATGSTPGTPIGLSPSAQAAYNAKAIAGTPTLQGEIIEELQKAGVFDQGQGNSVFYRANNDERTEMQNMVAGQRAWKEAWKIYNELKAEGSLSGTTGPLDSKLGKVSRAYGWGDPRVTRLNSILQKELSSYMMKISGATVPAEEVKRLAEQVPNLKQGDSQFITEMEAYNKSMNRGMNNIKTKYGFGTEQDVERVLYGNVQEENQTPPQQPTQTSQPTSKKSLSGDLGI